MLHGLALEFNHRGGWKRSMDKLEALSQDVTRCRKCPRLVAWREEIAREKRAAFKDEEYWGKPVPGFGDPEARLVLVGLAPAAHGANRTGRMFTGDRSGDWLYRSLHRAGFANQPESVSRGDGLTLNDVYVTAMVRCAPPANKPTIEERDQCLGYLLDELNLLSSARILLALGKFGWDGALMALARLGFAVKPKPKFSHGAEVEVGPYVLLGSFHPSQQNTFTGKLTQPMFDGVFERAKMILGAK
jgi:uracil-DNA glycosylase family 4